MASREALTADALLARFPAPIVDLANELRPLVRRQVPNAQEVAYGGWKALGYRHPEAGYIGGIFLFDDRVAMIFEQGHLLPDPEGILQGETKQTRHVTLWPKAEVPLDALADLLEAAVDVGRDLRVARRA